MSNFKIEIQGQKYPIKFGYGAFRLLGALWECAGTVAVMQKLSALDNVTDAGLTFEQEDMISDLICAGISCAVDNNTEVPERDDIMQDVLFDAEKLQAVFKILEAAFPQPGNPKPAPKAGKKKPKK